jgi:hypothetical protein
MITKSFMPRFPVGLLLSLGLCAAGPNARAWDDPLPLDPPNTSGVVDDAPDILAPVLPDIPPAVPEPVPKRLFGIIPNYRADQNRQNYQPLTTAEKFGIARKDTFDWPNFFLLAGYAAQSQVASGGGFSHNGGFPGFGEFYARALGDAVISNYTTEAILPMLLHEDPRYFRLGQGHVWYRAFYAASRVLITRTDKRRARFNTSEIVGNVGVVALTSLYYPKSQSADEGAERYSIQIGNDVVANLITEFWPDIKRHMPFRHH